MKAEKKTVALLALGAHDTIIPCMFFDTIEEGLGHVKRLFPEAEFHEAEDFGGPGQVVEIPGYYIDNLPEFKGVEGEVEKLFASHYTPISKSCCALYLAEFPHNEVLFSYYLD